MNATRTRWVGVAVALLLTLASTGAAAGGDRRSGLLRIERDGKLVTTVVRGTNAGRSPAPPSATGGGGLLNGDFSDGLDGWIAGESGGGAMPGSVTPDSGQALFLEGDSFRVFLEQTFTVQATTSELTFDLLLAPGFDLGSNFIPDAFEATLLDAGSGLPVVPPWDFAATSFFNMQEDGTVNLGSATTWNGTTATVDLAGVPTGTSVTVYLDLIGGDFDTGSGVRVDDVVTCTDTDGDGLSSCDDNCPDDANPGQTDIDGDGIGDACDACTDVDTDGYGDPGDSSCTGGPDEDCDDSDPDVFPGNPEQCDAKDNDCNGLIDDGNPDGGTPCPTGLLGVCATGTEFCVSGGLTCIPDTGPGCEICGNGLDDDCDGTVDETTDDFDGDGVLNCDDNCCDAFNPDQTDSNDNGVGDQCDCTDLGEIGNSVTVFEGPMTQIGWDAVPGVDEYHVYRGFNTGGNPFEYNQQCMVSNVAGTTTVDPLTPLTSAFFYYLVTAKCPVGEIESSLGVDSAGSPRPQPFVCPDPTADVDGDGTDEALDNCPGLVNVSQSDVDSDSHGDSCDNCVFDSNTDQSDLDGDGLGNACDRDVDGDGILDDGDGSGTAGDAPCPDMVTVGCDDNCPTNVNPGQEDSDGDGIGDDCDPR